MSGPERWDLNGKRAFITGGTRGIGAATVDQFRRLGAEVIALARQPNETPEGVGLLIGDIASPMDRERVVRELTSRWDRLDILVNNAGMNIRKPWAEMSAPERDAVTTVNLHGPADLTSALLPLLLKGHNPAVVNVASVAAFVDVGSGATYAMSKAALVQFTRSLAVEWAPKGIRVNAVAPWYIRTPLTEPVLSQPDRLERILERTPMKRVGTPAEVAAAITFLAMDKASFITGACLAVDGGFLAQGL